MHSNSPCSSVPVAADSNPLAAATFSEQQCALGRAAQPAKRSSATLITGGLLFIGAVAWFEPRPETVSGTSMLPALNPGSQALSVRRTSIKRFDLVVFQDPQEPGESDVKRVVGLPGETVSVRSGQLYINGLRCHEPACYSPTTDMLPVTVPRHAVFVLGDNRANSADSRCFGCIPVAQLRTLVSWTLVK